MTDELLRATSGRKIGYARVSTKDQNLDLQLIALKKAGCDAVFTDHGIPGKIFPRKGLSAALSALQHGDTLVVYKLDRLGRSVFHLAGLLEQFEAKGANIQSLNQAIDISTASGKLTYFIFSAFAEFESNLNGERTRGGMEASRAHGVHLGRPLKLNDDDVRSARRMLEIGGASMGATARLFKVSHHTMRRALKRLDGPTA